MRERERGIGGEGVASKDKGVSDLNVHLNSQLSCVYAIINPHPRSRKMKTE